MVRKQMRKAGILKNYFGYFLKVSFFTLDEKSAKIIKIVCKNLKSDILHLDTSVSKDSVLLPTQQKTIKPGSYFCGPFVFYISVEADTRKVLDEIDRLAAEVTNSKLYRKLAAMENYTYRKITTLELRKS